jgi:transposase, IS5 family
LKRLSDLGDQLETFEAAVEFEAFRPELNAAFTYSDGTQGGRPPFDPVMMFKILVKWFLLRFHHVGSHSSRR